MLKEKDVEDFMGPIRIEDPNNEVTVQSMSQSLAMAAQSHNLPVSLDTDQLKAGGLFSKETFDGVVVSHPEHKKDYYKFFIYTTRQGNTAFVNVKIFGSSKQLDKEGRLQAAKAYSAQQTQMSAKIGVAIGAGLRNLGHSKQKAAAEHQYYDVLQDVIAEAFGVEG